MKKIISILLLTLIFLFSLVACNAEKEPTTEYIRYEGDLLDISTLPKKAPFAIVDFDWKKPKKYFEETIESIKQPSVKGVILKITILDYAESITGTPDNISLVDCIVEKVFYQNEQNPIQLHKGQNVKCVVNYNVESVQGSEPVFMAHDIITILRKDHSYIILGAMNEDGTIGYMYYCGAFELSSDDYERAFYEFVGINRAGAAYYYDVKARVLKYYN